MKSLDILGKLGILRYGTTAAVYKSGRDRPAELMMDDVFDAERDLVRAEDALPGKRNVQPGKPGDAARQTST
jgi:hypothetical protein